MRNESIKAKIIKIGNSQGVRLPKPILAMSGIEDSVEIRVVDGLITIRAAKPIRDGWSRSFQSMASVGDDLLIDSDIATDWDNEEWEWK